MPVGDDRGVTSLALSESLALLEGGTKLHGSLKLSSRGLLFVDIAAGHRASMTLLYWAPGRFNSAMRGLTFPLWGDLARRSDLHPW